MHWRHNPFLRQLHARPRLLLACALGILFDLALPESVAARTATRFLLSWNAAVWLYLVLNGVMIARSSHETLHRRSQLNEAGRRTVLVLVIVAVVASLLAIVDELLLVKSLQGASRLGHIALTGATIVSSWLFMHLMFALHYAHDYYLALSRNQPPGLQFPGDETPDYEDFLYFSGVIGTSGQTADVAFTSRAMRRFGLVHCVVSFFFNTTVLALAINLAASLL